MLSVDFALGRAHPPALPLPRQLAHSGVLVDRDTFRGSRLGQPDRIVQRMQMHGATFPQRIAVALAAQQFAQRGARHEVPVHAELFGEKPLALAQHARIAEPVGPDHALVDHRAGNAVFADTRADQLHAAQRTEEQRLGMLLTKLPDQRFLAARIAGEDKTSVAPRGAETDVIAFQQRDIGHAALGQAQDRVQARVTAADHHDTPRLPARQRGEAAVGCGRGAVVACRQFGHRVRVSRAMPSTSRPTCSQPRLRPMRVAPGSPQT